MLARFSEITSGGYAGFHRSGFLFLHPEEDENRVRATISHLSRLGIDVEVVERDRLESEFPAFDLEGVAIGGWEADAGYADPTGATVGLLGRAVELGAELRVGSRVAELLPAASGGATVVTADGARASCSRVLIAAGPWTAPLAAQVGVDVPLTVERHVVATLGWGRAPRLPFGHADLVAGYYCRPEGTELCLLGWLHPAAPADPDRYAPDIMGEEAEGLSRALVRRVPSLAEAELRGGWAGLYDVSPDWQPVIGEIADGIFVDAGTSGHGFKLAPALGGYVADMVLGRATHPGLVQFHPARFATGGRLSAGFGAAKILG